jgi:hypothetical protein
VTSDDPAFDGMQGNVGRVAARYLPHRECEAYVAGPVAMVQETIRVLARAGIPPQRIHYDDALLAEDKRVSVPRPRDEAEEAGAPANIEATGDTGTRDESAENPNQDENTQNSGPGPGTDDETAERQQVPASVLAGRDDTPQG